MSRSFAMMTISDPTGTCIDSRDISPGRAAGEQDFPNIRLARQSGVDKAEWGFQFKLPDQPTQ